MKNIKILIIICLLFLKGIYVFAQIISSHTFLSIVPYKQCQSPWRDHAYGNACLPGSTFCNTGCYLTCLSMILATTGTIAVKPSDNLPYDDKHILTPAGARMKQAAGARLQRVPNDLSFVTTD